MPSMFFSIMVKYNVSLAVRKILQAYRCLRIIAKKKTPATVGRGRMEIKIRLE